MQSRGWRQWHEMKYRKEWSGLSGRYPQQNPGRNRPNQKTAPDSYTETRIANESTDRQSRQVGEGNLKKICDPKTQARNGSVELHHSPVLLTIILAVSNACLAIASDQAFQFLQLAIPDPLVLQQIDQ